MVDTKRESVENFIEGSEAFIRAKKWLKVSDRFRFVKPVRRYAEQEAINYLKLAETYFRLSDCFSRVERLEQTMKQ